MMHRYHPNPERNDPESAILYDDCERCNEHAEDPQSLDDWKLRQAWGRSQLDDWSGTANERRVFSILYMVSVLNERLDRLGVLP